MLKSSGNPESRASGSQSGHAFLKYVPTIFGLCFSRPTVASCTKAHEPGTAAEALNAANPPPDPPTNITLVAPQAFIAFSTTLSITAWGSQPDFPKNQETRMSCSPPKSLVGSVNARNAPVRDRREEIRQNIG